MKKFLRNIIMVLLIMVFTCSNFSLAADGTAEAKANLIASKTEVSAGDTVEVTLSASCEDGLIGIESTLNYDKSIFTLADKTASDGWSILANEDTLNVVLSSATEKKTGDVFKLTFNVKENVAATTSDIKLTGLKLYKTYTNIVNSDDKKVSIKVNGGANQGASTKTLSKIEITKAPSSTTYKEGEKFDPSGMEVKASYSDNSTAVVNNYTYSPNEALKSTNKEVTISYTEGSVTKTATQQITVGSSQNNNNNNSSNDKANSNSSSDKNSSNSNANNNSKNSSNSNSSNSNSNKSNTNTNTNTSTTNTSNTAVDNSTSGSSSLPKTGSKARTTLVVIATLIAVAFIFLKKYDKYKEI